MYSVQYRCTIQMDSVQYRCTLQMDSVIRKMHRERNGNFTFSTSFLSWILHVPLVDSTCLFHGFYMFLSWILHVPLVDS